MTILDNLLIINILSFVKFISGNEVFVEKLNYHDTNAVGKINSFK